MRGLTPETNPIVFPGGLLLELKGSLVGCCDFHALLLIFYYQGELTQESHSSATYCVAFELPVSIIPEMELTSIVALLIWR